MGDAEQKPSDELVRRCLEIGLTAEEIREAGDDLLELAVQRIYAAGDEQLTMAEVAGRAGVPPVLAERIARAGGLLGSSDDDVFNEHDVAVMATLAPAFDLLGEDAVLQMVRVAAAAVARVGDAAMSTFLTSAAAPAFLEDESGLLLLDANRAAAELLPRFGDLMTQMLLRYLRQAFRPMSEMYTAAALTEGVDTRRLAIGFADLVGSTTHAGSRSLSELNAALDVFERAATETITTGGGRVVKFIGDEVMFRADTADIACGVALDLVDFVRADPDLPPLRAGIAFGEVLSREGDYYGPVVNLAARVTKLAPLHGVVVTADTTEALEGRDDFAIHPLGAIEMQGLSAPVELASLSSP